MNTHESDDMENRRDVLFGLAAVSSGKVTPIAIQQAVQVVGKNSSKDIGEWLVKEGHLSAEEISDINAAVELRLSENDSDLRHSLNDMTQSRDGQSVLDIFDCTNLEMLAPPHPEASLPFALEDVPSVPETPGRYHSAREHARGGVGRIYLVHDAHLGRDVIRKELLGDSTHAADDTQQKTASAIANPGAPLQARFLQEAKITSQLEHPSIVSVHELGRRDDGTLYYTMKYVRGRTFDQAIKDARTLRDRLALLSHFMDLCQAVAYAHSKGIIHRDIKPGNVMVGQFGETVVIDWGLAKTRSRSDIHRDGMTETTQAFQDGDSEDIMKTAYGRIMGTPVYMAPEQAKGQIDRVDERSDVYALGAVLYSLLTSHAPFEGNSVQDVLHKVIHKDPVAIPVHEPEAPIDLTAICKRAMAKDPASRYQSAKELAEEIDRFQSGALVQAYEYSLSEYMRRLISQYKAIVSTAAGAVLLLFALWGIYSYRLVQTNAELEVARDSEIAQRAVTEETNKQLVWENYANTLTNVQHHIGQGNVQRALEFLETCPPEHRHWEWGYLKRQSEHDLLRLAANDGDLGLKFSIHDALISPDNRYVLVDRPTSGIKTVVDLLTAEPIWDTPAWRGWRACSQFLPNGREMYLGLSREEVGRVELLTGEIAIRFKTNYPDLRDFAFHPEGPYVAGFAHDQQGRRIVSIWRADNADRVKTIQLRDLDNHALPGFPLSYEGSFSNSPGGVLGFISEGRELVYYDEHLRVHNVDSGEESTLTSLDTYSLAFSTRSGRAAVATASGNVDIWDCVNRERVHSVPVRHGAHSPYEMDLSSDGDWLSVRVDGNYTAIWRVGDEKPVATTPAGRTSSIRFSPEATSLVIISNKNLSIWPIFKNRTSKLVGLSDVHGEPAQAIYRRGHSSRYVIAQYNNAVDRFATTDSAGMMHLWDVQSFSREKSWQAHDAMITALNFSRDGSKILTSANDGVAALWDLASESEPPLRIKGDMPVLSSALSPDANDIAMITGRIKKSADRDDRLNTVTVYNAHTGEPKFTICQELKNLGFLAYSPDGRWLAVGENHTHGDEGGVIYLCDTQDKYRIVAATEPIGGTWQIRFSPDSSKMAAVGRSGDPIMWDLIAQRQLWRLRDAYAMGLAFHPNGDRVFISPGDSAPARAKAAIHAVEDGRELVTVDIKGRFLAPTFSPDGLWLWDLVNPDVVSKTAQVIHADDWTITDKNHLKQIRLTELNEVLNSAPPK
jgi:serine/threonine protein kinase/WD40 repeat protein